MCGAADDAVASVPLTLCGVVDFIDYGGAARAQDCTPKMGARAFGGLRIPVLHPQQHAVRHLSVRKLS